MFLTSRYTHHCFPQKDPLRNRVGMEYWSGPQEATAYDLTVLLLLHTFQETHDALKYHFCTNCMSAA